MRAGTSILPQAVGYAEAALGSPEPNLRRLGAAQLGRLLLLDTADAAQCQAAAGVLAVALEVGAGRAHEQQRAALCCGHTAASLALLGCITPDSIMPSCPSTSQ